MSLILIYRGQTSLSSIGDIRNAYKILVLKPEEKKLFRRSRCRWEGNSKVDLKEVGCEDMDRVHLAQDRDQ
jgi:hypothetical protein